MVSAGAGMAKIFLTAILSLIVLFFLLKEGRAIRVSLEKMAVRLGGERGRHLLFVAGSTMRSVVFGILGAAIVQGILAIFGLWISGVPSPVFIGAVAGLFALVPIGLIQVVLLPAQDGLILQRPDRVGHFSRHLVFSRGRKHRQRDSAHVDQPWRQNPFPCGPSRRAGRTGFWRDHRPFRGGDTPGRVLHDVEGMGGGPSPAPPRPGESPSSKISRRRNRRSSRKRARRARR